MNTVNYQIPNALSVNRLRAQSSNMVGAVQKIGRTAMERATIKDVAKLAGVSNATVSHVMNNTRFVSDETKQIVNRAIEELNYRPSQIARSLSVQRTSTVGLLISDVGNPFYYPIIQGVENVAHTNNYNVYLLNAGYDQTRSIKYIRSMIERRADGIILMSSRMSMEIVDEATRQKIPTVVLDWNEISFQDATAIHFDFERSIRQAVTHLIELGHRRFAHVAGDLSLWTARIRRDLYLKILSEHGISPATVPVVEGNFKIEGGRRALHQLMSFPDKPTAVFTVNDLTAIGLIFEAKHLGLSVPDDFSVIGVDDIGLASQITPSLTTLALPGFAIGELCMSSLLDLLNNPTDDDGLKTHLVESKLILRESTAAAKLNMH